MYVFFVCLFVRLFVIRISQDLAKDLAMLAREIHDVAGEIDSVSPAATDPGALVVTHCNTLTQLLSISDNRNIRIFMYLIELTKTGSNIFCGQFNFVVVGGASIR